MRFLNWLNRHLGKSETPHNLQFDSHREDGNAKLDLVRLEDRIVLSVSAALGGISSDVLQLNLDTANDEATVSVIDSGATLQVDDGQGLPGSILQFDASQINSILVTGTDSSQVINLLGQEDLVIPGAMDLTNFTGEVNIGIEIVLGPGESPQFNSASAVKYLGQFELTGDQLDIILPNELNVDDAFIIQINGPNLEILDPTDLATPLFSAPTASINSIHVLGADGESDLLTLDYSTPGMTDIAITFNGGSGGNDALEFVEGSFDTITHDLIGPTTGSVDFVDNGITEISYGGLEPVFGVSSTSNHIIINLPANTNDAVLENTAVPGEMQIRSLSAAFEFTTFSMPAESLTINTLGGSSLVVFDSFDATFAPTNLILSGTTGDTFQLTGSDLLADSVSLTLSSGATLDLGAFNETIAGFTLEDGSVIATSGVLSLQSSLELRSGTVSADLSGTDLIKNSSGTVILNGTNSFTGSTTVQNGVLQVEGSLTSTQVVIESGATLGGSGTIDAPVTVNSGGVLVPGSSPGIISTGDLTLGAGATLDIEIEGTQVGTEYDQIQVTGSVDVTGATLNLISVFTAAAGNEFILIDNDGADAVTGTFVGLTEGTLFTFNGNQVFISYQGGDGNDVVLTVNSPPVASNQIFNVDENSINTTPVGTITATDTDLPPDSLTFSVTGGTGQFVFDVSTSGDITVADQSQLDFENTSSFDLDLLVTDSAGATDTATITINLNPINDNDPVVVNQIRTVDENTLNGTNVGAVIAASDDDLPGDTLTFSENGGTGAAAFDITAAGQIVVADQSLLNFETNPTYTLDIIVDDNAGGTDTATITINLNDLAETLFVNPADWSVNDITVVRDGSQLRVLETGTANEIIPAHEFANVTDVVITGNASNNIVRLDYTGIITPAGGISFNGGVGSDSLQSLNLVNNWMIDGVNSGSLQAGSVSFSDVENLIGDAGTDLFQVTGSGQITGSIDALDGIDTLDYTASTALLDLMLTSVGTSNGFAGSEISTVTAFDNINSIIGSSNSDSLTGINDAANWSLDGTDQYTSTNTLDFSEFENLSGGTNVDTFEITGSQTHNLMGDAGNDLFQFQNGASLIGSIDGQAGADKLDYSLFSTSIDAVLIANGSFDGFQGTETAISGGFDNINEIIAGSGVADQLTGRDAAATWTIQPASIYGSVTSLGFSNFEILQGGSDVDIFNINGSHTLDLSGGGGADLFQFDNNGSSINGTIDGQDGDDHLNLTNYSDNLSATLTSLGSIDGFSGNESAKSLVFENINQLTGGSGTNSLTGLNSAANWTLNGSNSYQSTNSLGFSNFINLQGGTDSDSFYVTPDTAAFHIFGGDPTSNPLGDQLNVDTSAAGTALVSSDGVGAGTITGSFPTITYTEIENFTISGVVDVQVDGTTNNDVIEILVVGPNVEYRLGGTLIGTSSLADTNQITVNGGDGDDSLAVDVALATEGITITYNGEGQVTTNPGDVLSLLGTTNSVEYFFADISSGSVRIDGDSNDFIVYTGLEPITSTVTAADVTLNYSGVAETITITDAGGGQTTVNSTAGELLTFTNPTNSLTINTGAGDDIIDINSLAASFTAALTINGEADTDTINANASISFDSGKNVIFNAENINIANSITITASGIALNAIEVNLDGDLVSANVSGDAATINVPGSLGGADMQDAVDVAGTGGVINVAAGSYLTTGTLNVDESVSILGADKDTVEIRKTGDPSNNFDVAVNVSADNVTISGAQLGWETHTAATDYQGYVVLTTADNTTLTNLLFGDNYRSAVVFVGADNLEVSDSIFEGKFGRAAIRDGSGGSGENFLITGNEFRADHFRWGPIAIGPQGTFGDPNNFAFSGEISFNYFGNGLEAGSFQEAGDQNYTITITNGGMTADGIDIFHNSFDWQDSSTTNGNGIFAQPGGIFFDPSLSVPIGTVNITDNIFNGFTYDGPQPTTDPLWNPTGGVFGGALEFDGVDDFGLFQDVNFDVGEAGTLSFWVNMDDQGKRNQFFEGPNNGGMEFQYRSNGGGQFFGSPSRNGNSNNYAIQDGGAGGTEGVWQNIQYTWDFNAVGNPQMHIFIDGVEIGYLNSTFDSDLTQWVSTVSTINELMNVARDPGSGRYFDGLMDDVGWFDQALDQTDRDAIRATGVATLAADARLVAHWDFDQASGDIAIDNKNGIEMLISTNGIVPFGPEFQQTAGQFGGALQFDGIDDFATFQDASFDVGRKGTLNFWVQMEDTGRRNQFFEGPDNGGLEFQYRSNGGGQFYGRTQDGADFTIQSGGHAGVETFWTNIQYTWDADTGEMHIYLNGVEEPYLASFDENLAGFDSTHFTDTINGLMNVGRDPGDASRYFEGLMDDIGWFNDVLNQTDRDAIRANGVADLTGDGRLVAHWNLDDAPGTTVVSGNSGTNIDLYIQAEPPLPPIQGFGVLAPLNANVTYNAFNNNDLDSNVTLDSTNILGDPLYAYASNPLFVITPSLEEQFTIGFGSSAAYTSSEFAGDTNTIFPHIGAYQGPPVLFPGSFGQGDIVIFGTDEDDLLELTLTSEDTATFVLTRDVGGAGETVLGTVLLTDITSITFNGLGGDDLLILNQPDNLFFNPSGGIIFNGGTQNNDGNSSNPFAATGDTLIINHNTPVEADSVGYVFTPDAIPAEGEDGIITITDAVISDGSTTITFTGLEPILDNLLVADRDFDFTDATETISLSDGGLVGDDYSFIDSDLSESVLFLNPNNSITIRTDSVGTPVGVDTVNINSLDSVFDASLTILAGSDDSVTFQSTTDLVTGDLFVTAQTVNILADVNAASVEMSSSGLTSTTFNGGTVTTTGSQLYNNEVNFITNSTLTSSGGANIEFISTIDGAVDLIIDTAGSTIFGGAIGGNSALTSLTTDAAGTTNINGGSVNTTANQTYNDDILIGTNTTLTSTDPGNITFDKTLNGAFTLDVNTAGITNFNGTIGNSAALTSLTTDTDGTTNINGGSVNTTGDQTFHDDIVLGANTTLTSTDPGNITFNKTLNGTFTLDVNTEGITTFTQQVGNNVALASLTTNANGTTNINGGSVETTGSQTYHDAVTLGGSTLFTSNTTGDITFNSTLTGGGGIDIGISSTNNIILNAAVNTDGNVTATADSDLSGSGDMTMQVGSSLDAGSGTIDIDGANVTTRSVTTTNTSATSVTIDATNGNVTTMDNGVNSRGDISITATGTVTLEDFGVNTGDGSGVVIQATGDIASTGTGIVTTLGTGAGGSIGITSNTGEVDFTDGNVLTGDGGNINVDAVTGFSALNSTFDTTNGTGSGSVEINVSAGSNSITTGGITVNEAGTILLTAEGATSDIIISSSLTSADGSITLLADNDITLSSTTSIISQAGGSITLTADHDGSNAGSITMDSGSTVESQGGQIILSAYDDIALSAITTTGGRVDVTSMNGNITDNDLTVAKNVTASQLVLNANTGIGDSTDAIDTTISFLEADAGLGGFFLDNMGNLTVGNITPQVGIDAALEILVNVMGTLDITENVQSASESVTFNATDELIVNLATTISTFGAGVLLLTSDRNIKLNSGSNLNTVNGGISLIANNGGTATGDFIGVEAENATIITTGIGAISITGFGGDDIASNNHHGVHLHTGTTIDSSSSGADAGTITINGTGGTGIDDNAGVRIDGASTNVTSVDGNIQITGDTAEGDGIQIDNQGVVISTGTGVNAATITLNGTTASDNAGITLTSNVQSTDGDISITGTTTGGGAASEGVIIQNTTGQINSSDGNITIDGTSNGDDGIQISDSSSISVTGSGNIELLGDSTGTGSGINFDATINSNTGTITLTAEDDILLGSVALVDSTSGTVTVTADNAPGNNSNPITMTNGALIDAGSGNINLATDGTVLLGGLLTTGQVSIDSFSSDISDNGDDHTDIVASTAVLNAVTGIGDGNPLETDITTLSATVSGIGNIFIDNGLDVNLLDVSTFDGNITINATASITATSVVSTNNSASEDNDITLTATGTNSDILVTTITATGNADVTLTADDGILDTNGADTNRITADNLTMTSSSAGGTSDGIDVDTSVNSVTAAVNTNPGGIRIDEVDSIILTQITTANGSITVNAGGTIQVLEVDSENSSNSDGLNGIMLTATGATSDIIITSLTAQNTADITLDSGRDILDSDSSDANITFGDHLTATAVRNIGGITSIFTEAGFDPLQTTVDHMDLTSGNIIAIHNTGTSPELINLDAGTLSAGTTFVRATGGSLDVSLTTGISNLQDNIGFVSDTSITVPTGLDTANLRLDAPNIIDAGGGNIDINAVNAILFNSAASETVEITAQQFDGTVTGGDFIIINDSPALQLIDLDSDATALTGGTDTNISLTSAGSITVANLVRTLGTGTLLIETTNTDGDLTLNQNIQSDTGSVTISTARDIIFNDSNNLTSTSGSIILTADTDNISDGTFGGITMSDGSFINAGDGTVSLDATDDISISQIITTNATDLAIQIETDSSVVDSGDSTGEDLIANETGARLTIISALGVGKVADPNGALETQVDQIDITNLTSGEIQIIETDAIIIHDMIQSTAGNISVIAGDNIRLSGLIQTTTGDVLLDTQAAIIDQNDGLPDPLNIHAVNLDLNAITGIGIGDTLELSVDSLSADTTNGDILLHNTATTGVTATSITTGTGDIELEQIGNESLTVNLASTDDGNITISNEGNAQTDVLTLTSITAGGTAPEITLSTIGFGDILLGDISGLTGLISVTSAGNINDAVNDQGAPVVDIDASSGSIILQALNGIGNNETVELAAKDISINSTTGNIEVSNLSSLATGDVTVSKLTSGLGTIDFAQTGGQSLTFEEISTTNSNITVLSDGSMTFENPGILTNVVSTDGAGAIEITATGVNSSIQINDGFITDGGTIDITAENSLMFGAEGDLSSANGNVTLLADSASRGAGGGGIMMSDGTIFNAGTGIVDLQAGDDITVGQLFTTTLSRLTSTAGGVVDAGDTGGTDITANELAIRTAAGAGSTNALETAVSLLAATNSDSGSIQIHNDIGGGLLTISLVDGIDGISNAAGVAGDIIITNASPLTVNAPVTNSSGGNIGLESSGPGDLILNSPIRAFGGNGNINLEAGDGILDFNDTGIASDHSIAGTGVFSGHGEGGVVFDSDMTLNSETGAIADIPPALSNIFTPQILATGDATVTGDFGRFTEENFFITIDWGDGTVETTNFSSPGSFLFTHNYAANPNIANPSAPIPIIVTMQGDLQFTFSDGSGNLDFTTETGLLETPGDGLATVAIDTTPQVPLLLFPPTVEILDASSNQQTVFTSQDTVSLESSINEANKNAERLVFLRILAPNGDVIEDVVLQESDLDNLPKLFKSLPDGRYQLYLKEAGEERIRLLMDVDIRGGKATDVTEDQTPPADNQNPANDKTTTQKQTKDPAALYANQNSLEEKRNLLATVFTTDADDTPNPNDFLFSDRFTIDGYSTGLPMDQNLIDTNTHQSAVEIEGMQDSSTEKIWSSAALLSGYFHGKSLLKKPAKQDEFEDAMSKYGRRLFNRHYNMFKK